MWESPVSGSTATATIHEELCSSGKLTITEIGCGVMFRKQFRKQKSEYKAQKKQVV